MAMLKVRPVTLCILRYASQAPPGKPSGPTPPGKPTGPTPGKTSSTASTPPPLKQPPIPATAASAVGPKEDPTKYNVPEYYQHSEYSFYDFDAALKKHRMPQPNKFAPLQPQK